MRPAPQQPPCSHTRTKAGGAALLKEQPPPRTWENALCGTRACTIHPCRQLLLELPSPGGAAHTHECTHAHWALYTCCSTQCGPKSSRALGESPRPCKHLPRAMRAPPQEVVGGSGLRRGIWEHKGATTAVTTHSSVHEPGHVTRGRAERHQAVVKPTKLYKTHANTTPNTWGTPSYYCNTPRRE